MKRLEERFFRQHLKPLYLRNEAYDIFVFFLHFLVCNFIHGNKNITFMKMSLHDYCFESYFQFYSPVKYLALSHLRQEPSAIIG